MNILGKKSVVTSLGQKAKDVVVKGLKVASMVGLGGAALVGAAQAISDASNANVRMVSAQSALSRASLGPRR